MLSIHWSCGSSFDSRLRIAHSLGVDEYYTTSALAQAIYNASPCLCKIFVPGNKVIALFIHLPKVQFHLPRASQLPRTAGGKQFLGGTVGVFSRCSTPRCFSPILFGRRNICMKTMLVAICKLYHICLEIWSSSPQWLTRLLCAHIRTVTANLLTVSRTAVLSRRPMR